MKKVGWSMLWATIKQLAAELLLPAVCAAVATAYQYHAAPGGIPAAWQAKPVFDHASAYFLKLFFFGAFFAYFLRAMKTVRDRRNHDSVIKRQEAVLTRLEALSTDLSGHTTGGNGFCYVWSIQTRNGEIVALDIAIDGNFALREVSIGVTSLESAKQRLRASMQTGDIQHALQSDHNFKLTIVTPNQILSLPCRIPLTGAVSRYWVRWNAANGHWTQQLEIDANASRDRVVRTRVHRQDHSMFFSPKDTVQDEDAWNWDDSPDSADASSAPRT
ncbi:hypothetical protein CDL60_14180 [Roseateles noduli]|nr:hypothetical protein CDL60_14180 [Roseateles noduli]